MTNRDYLKSLLRDKDEMFQKIAMLTETRDKKIVSRAIEQYNILDEFCQRLANFIDSGIMDGDAEKRP